MEVIDQLIQADQDLFLHLNGLGTEKWDAFWMFITNKKSWIPFYALLLVFLLIKLKHWKKIVLAILCVAALVLIVDQTTNLFKDGFQRFRPCFTPELDGIMRLVKSYCGGRYSFFSGHSSNSFALAVFLGLLLKKYAKYLLPFMLVWAAMVAYSRVYIGVHFPLDIFCGAIWGCIWGYLLFKLYTMISRRIKVN